MTKDRRRWTAERGYAMAALLVLMSVMAIAMSTALPVWHTMMQREKEDELIFRGNQYAHAIAMFQRMYGGAFPPNVDVLVREKFLRKKYKDPITGGDFQVVSPGDPAAAALLPSAGSATPGAATATGVPPGAGGRAAQPASSMGTQGSPQTPQTLGSQAGGLGSSSQSAFGQPGPLGQPAGIGASAGVMGVRSKSTEKSFRLYNGRDRYNQWIFVGTQASQQAGAPTGAQAPGGRGAPAPGAVPAPGSPFGAPGGGFPQGGRRFGGP